MPFFIFELNVCQKGHHNAIAYMLSQFLRMLIAPNITETDTINKTTVLSETHFNIF